MRKYTWNEMCALVSKFDKNDAPYELVRIAKPFTRVKPTLIFNDEHSCVILYTINHMNEFEIKASIMNLQHKLGSYDYHGFFQPNAYGVEGSIAFFFEKNEDYLSFKEKYPRVESLKA